jgi:SAM-dependent methyltransferase
VKEQDIRRADLMARYLELTAADARRLFGDASKRVDVPCPGCGAADSPAAFVKEGFQYRQCAGCRTLYASPRPTPSDLDVFYGDSPSATYWAETFFPAVLEARRERMFRPRVEKILSLLDARGFAPSTVIDVGAGHGLFLEELRAVRPAVTPLAVEPGAKLAAICRAKSLEVLEAPVEGATEWAGRGDLVVCFEVLEHVFSTLEFLTAIATLAKPGAYVVLSTLGSEGFDIQVLWDRSKSVSPPHHLNFLGLEGFKQLFARAGLVDVEVLTPGKLDTDIVRNTFADTPAAAEGQRFVQTLLSRDPAVAEAFQKFLADHQLSSHTWVLARRAG